MKALHCHSGAAQRRPESITAEDAEERATLVAHLRVTVYKIPGSAMGSPRNDS